MTLDELKLLKIGDLKEIAKSLGFTYLNKYKKEELINAIYNAKVAETLGFNREIKEDDKSEIEKPEIEKPEIEKPEIEKPEIEKPDTDKPDADAKNIKIFKTKNNVLLNDDEDIEIVERDLPETLELQPDIISKDDADTQVVQKDDVEGVLDISEAGFGFLRFDNYQTSDKDVYVPHIQIKRFNLKTGDKISGIARKARTGEKFRALLFINQVNGMSPDIARKRSRFDDLTPTYPNKKITLETNKSELSTRIIDLVSPIGRGQRGLIVAPPKAGKTILLKKIAKAIRENHKDIELIVLLIDERPEEVTDMKRSIDADVIFSTFDELPENHIQVATMVLQRAKALVEMGKDVVVLLDSITRLARAYNLSIPSSGRTLSGGLDPAALHWPKRFLGAARNTDEAGSLTILATALIDTGSRMDDVIFEEFKGTGNMELILSRKLSEKRVFPAIDIEKSGTRREELILTQNEIEAVWLMRKAFSNLNSQDVTEEFLKNMIITNNNFELVEFIRKQKFEKNS